ncbi:HAD family phosphatase [Nonomuraea sp. NPDC026600]|uniref:HAD family hydrolase n=1 Tax=Nonomuraea sp. NPDC026600 TaxID=3155363 RepID=UPI0033DFD01E
MTSIPAATTHNQRHAVIFDCDGTLADSEPLARAAWESVLGNYGHRITDADAETVVGLDYPRVHHYYAQRFAGLPDHLTLWPQLREMMLDLIDKSLLPFDDAVSCARELAAAGVPIAVASSSPRVRLDATLEKLGLTGLFPITTAGDEVAHGKPAPDIFLKTAAALGVPATSCVVVEDSPSGIRAGHAAGMPVIAVHRADTLPPPTFDLAEIAVDALHISQFEQMLALPAHRPRSAHVEELTHD